IVRNDIVHRLSADTGLLESLEIDLPDFDAKVRADPLEFLMLHPFLQWRSTGQELQPGQRLSVIPPFVLDCPAEARTYKAVDALEHLRFLADFARQIKNSPDGTQVTFKFTD